MNMNFSFDADIILENEMARLQPLRMEDSKNLLKVATEDKNLIRYSPAQIYNEEFLKEYVSKSIRERKAGSRYSFSIFDKVRNAYAGSTSFLNISNADGRLEIGGTWIGKSFQRTGLNRNCKFLLLAFAFDQLGAERVEFKTDERNHASRTAIEKIGGQLEGVLRSHTVLPDGFRRNTVYYSILKDEWNNMKSAFISTH